MNPDPFLLGCLMSCLGLYAFGLRKLWRYGPGRGVSVVQAGSFFCGWCILVLALVWPFDALGAWLLSAHMTQHMLLMSAAPPLLLFGLPGVTCLTALPEKHMRGWLWPVRQLTHRKIWQLAAAPATAMLLQTAVIWVWHWPAAMDAALHSPPLHNAMHLSFLAAGLWFWMALLRSVRQSGSGVGNGLIALVGTMMQMGLLGALLTFADTVHYPFYLERAPHWNLTPLEDQQLAGLIMWVPGSLPYLAGGLILAAAWLVRSERALRHARPVNAQPPQAFQDPPSDRRA